MIWQGRHPATCQAHVTLEGIRLEAIMLDEEKFVREYTNRLTTANQMKETRGLYRRMLIQQVTYFLHTGERRTLNITRGQSEPDKNKSLSWKKQSYIAIVCSERALF
jgi:hypothetical protein